MARVQLQGIGKTYHGKTVLADIDLDIADGEFMVLVGSSGCGKSTLLRLLAGLEQASDGHILFDGEQADLLSPQQRNIAMVFQNYALYPHMSVYDNLAFPLRMRKMPGPRLQEQVQKIAAMLSLDDLLERKPQALSGGQRQRVAMGRAIVREPQVFLMDEPLSNLDANLRVQIRSDIAALQKRLAVTTIYVTHDQVEAMTLGDRVAVMHQGRLAQVDTPTQLYQNPANTVVARFLGNPGMNIVPITMLRGKGILIKVGEQTLLAPDGCYAPEQLADTAFFGWRPEAMSLNGNADNALSGHVVGVESIGHEQLIHVAIVGVEHPVVVRQPVGERPQLGEAVSVSGRDTMLFDARQNRLVDE